MTNKGNKVVRTNVLNNYSSIDDENDVEDEEEEEPEDSDVASNSYKRPSYLALKENCPIPFSTFDRL